MKFLRVVPADKEWVERPVPSESHWHRPVSRPATAIPAKRERKRLGTVVSVMLHALLIWFLLSPEALNVDPNLKEFAQGAGGPGPAGGGGGGNAGTGSIHFVKLAPPPTPVPAPVPTPQPVIEPPKPVEPVIPTLELPKMATEKVEVKVAAPIIGTGGGTGADGTNGNGPGTGGGVGSGIGPGRGSGIGPGTGGGTQENYPPSPTELFIPPMPVPSGVKGFHLIVNFDIDEKGKIIGLPVFTPTRDGGYNRKLQDYLKTFKFRPGTTPQGVPVRAKFSMSIDL